MSMNNVMSKQKTKSKAPPVLKEPRPLITMGDIWNIIFAGGAFLLQKASGALLALAKVPYNFISNVIKTLNKVPLAGKALSLPFQPIKMVFGGIVKIVSKFAGFFKIIFIILLVILAIKILLKLVSRIIYMRNKKKYKEYYRNLEERMDSQEVQDDSKTYDNGSEKSNTMSKLSNALKGMSFY